MIVFRPMTPFSSLQPKKVLFIATRQIGDVLVTTPLIAKARELWPNAQFHFLVGVSLASSLSRSPRESFHF